MNTVERRAIAALWSIQGIGPVTLKEIRARVGPLGELLEKPPSTWAPLVPWKGGANRLVMELENLAVAADRTERRCKEIGAHILFPDDPAFPSRLNSLSNAPPLLFALGPGAAGPARRRLAIVGTRRIDAGSVQRVMDIAAEAARHNLGIVSGAAVGVDQGAHQGALDAEGETWAFLGAALDEIDSAQLPIARAMLDNGGTLFSEFPPGFRANLNTFKIRNRLISGASDAVLVFRAPLSSGALHTAEAAIEQGRALLATPGDPWNPSALGSNRLLRDGLARPHLDVEDLLQAVGLAGSLSPAEPVTVDLSSLSPLAIEVLTELGRGSADFESLLGALPRLNSGQLSAALVELEVMGAVVHKGGRRYEKR